jgi:hypothetical protein
MRIFRGRDDISEQSQLIIETGSTGCFTTGQISKPCYADTLYKPIENSDAFALRVG